MYRSSAVSFEAPKQAKAHKNRKTRRAIIRHLLALHNDTLMKTSLLIGVLLAHSAMFAVEPVRYDFKVLATNKTSTMEREMNDAAQGGYAFQGVMGGDTAFGGKDVVV